MSSHERVGERYLSSLARPEACFDGEDRRQVQLLVRVLLRELDSLERGWLDLCAERASGIGALLTQALSPLLLALSAGRVQEAGLHVVTLASELRVSGLPLVDALELMRALEGAVNRVAPGAKWQEAGERLGRFLVRSVAHAYEQPICGTSMNSRVRLRASSTTDRVQHGFVGDSPAMQAMFAQVAAVARAPGPVLIAGESGTGKELVARALHQLGGLREAPFAAINCSALPHELIESELFGHEKGAFTGSCGSSPGLIRSAGAGVLFLDEITEMPLSTQPKLLRVLEQKVVRPIGSLREVPIEARVIAATNRDPVEALRVGTLRADLFYRLSAHRIDLPPLRERLEDLPALLEHFVGLLRDQGHRTPVAFSEESLSQLAGYAWPGNIRELRNVVEHCCAAAPDGIVEPRHLPRHTRCSAPAALEPRGVREGQDAFAPLHEIERRHICMALRKAGGNKALAARFLALSRHQLYLKLEKLQIVEW